MSVKGRFLLSDSILELTSSGKSIVQYLKRTLPYDALYYHNGCRPSVSSAGGADTKMDCSNTIYYCTIYLYNFFLEQLYYSSSYVVIIFEIIYYILLKKNSFCCRVCWSFFFLVVISRRRLCLKYNTFAQLEVCHSNQVQCIPINQKCNNCRLFIMLGSGFRLMPLRRGFRFFFFYPPSHHRASSRKKKKKIRSYSINNNDD